MSALEDEIVAAEEALIAAQLAGDVRALESLLGDDLHFVGIDGRTYSKADDLAIHRAGALRIVRMRVIERHVVDLDPVAVVTSLMDAGAIVDGQRHQDTLRYTRVWRRCEAGWQVIAGHMSAVRTDIIPRAVP